MAVQIDCVAHRYSRHVDKFIHQTRVINRPEHVHSTHHTMHLYSQQRQAFLGHRLNTYCLLLHTAVLSGVPTFTLILVFVCTPFRFRVRSWYTGQTDKRTGKTRVAAY